ncbi:hypothetical protein V6N13_087495 [Hibiscus sabdariffa]|uniref:Uncharacterized protein n=1 Tax=Hibiscus sabdariffa TaxID=183260 RepID=A0ABR2FX80_9ROSI
MCGEMGYHSFPHFVFPSLCPTLKCLTDKNVFPAVLKDEYLKAYHAALYKKQQELEEASQTKATFYSQSGKAVFECCL